jgi:hypothetical protein
VAASDIWAVGQAGGATFAEHFDGTTWSVVATANPPTTSGAFNVLLAVTALPDGTVVAVGVQSNGAARRPLILQ